MPSFSNVATLEPFGEWWCVRRGFRYCGSIVVDIPENCLTDFASIPRLLQVVAAPSNPRWSMPAVVHDYLYESHLALDALGRTIDVPREHADLIFWEAMSVDPQPTRVHAAPMILRDGFWAGVRVGGRRPYRTGPQRGVERRALYLSNLAVLEA